MIIITSIASSSKGNCYKISDGDSFLLIEAGVRLQLVREKIGFNLSSAAGCLVSHSHGDHAKHTKDMIKASIDVYTSEETAQAIDVNGCQIHHVKPLQQYKIQNWTVMPFDTEHDCPGSIGFLIKSKAGDKVLFATDTAYVRYKFYGITHLMIESNFSNEILNRNVELGRIDPSRKKRLLESHFSLDRVKEFLEINDNHLLREIHLMHLSEHNSDEEQFKREIQQLTGVATYVCGA